MPLPAYCPRMCGHNRELHTESQSIGVGSFSILGGGGGGKPSAANFNTMGGGGVIVKSTYEGGSICNENPFITPSTNALGLNAICQTKDQSVAVIMVHKTLFYLYKFNKLQTF